MRSDSSPRRELVELVRELDAEAERVARQNGERLRCRRGCSGCCADGLSVLLLEAERIRERHADLLLFGEPHPEGACAFLDAQGACRIYAERPYVCRTQGLPLRWLEEDGDGEIVEQRDICPLNAEGPALETLPAEACWLLGPFEQRLVALEEQRGELRRVALRDLFSRTRRRASGNR